MVIELLIIAAIGIGITVAAAALLWTRILDWSRQVLEPWITEHIPIALPWVHDALSAIDKVAVPVLKLIKVAWANLRKYLIHQVAEFEHKTGSTWLLRMTSWLRQELGPMQADASINKVVTERQVHYEDVPAEVREAWIRQNHAKGKIDVTGLRDQELEMQA